MGDFNNVALTGKNNFAKYILKTILNLFFFFFYLTSKPAGNLPGFPGSLTCTGAPGGES